MAKRLNRSAGIEWVAVDLDGTLAKDEGWMNGFGIGPPIPTILALVKRLLAKGENVKIFTARCSIDPLAKRRIRKWLKAQGLPPLEVTNVKDWRMRILYDDRAIQVEFNTGRIIEEIKNET